MRKDHVFPFSLTSWRERHASGLQVVGGFAVDKPAEPPTAHRGVFFRILDHDPSGRGGSGSESP